MTANEARQLVYCSALERVMELIESSAKGGNMQCTFYPLAHESIEVNSPLDRVMCLLTDEKGYGVTRKGRSYQISW